MLAIRRGTSADAALLTDLARRTFHDTYAADAPPDQLAIHLARAFSLEAQAAELTDQGLVTLLALVDDVPTGFAQVRIDLSHPVPPCVPPGPPVEVVRFYLEQAWAGRGIAGPLMEAVRAIGRGAGGTVAWLSVWEGNRRAIRFYEKCGFREVGRAPYRFGDRIEMDWVMSSALSAASAVQGP
jgi:ribosomal protein S18 acetylase RimI-like enzyme